MKALPSAVLAFACLTACDSGTVANDQTTTDPAEESASAPPDPEPAVTANTDATTIPEAIRGRWGLAAADCEPGRDDAKGLLIVTANKLEFYESVGTLDEIEDSRPNAIRASFDFTGEGMSWERDLLLELDRGGAALIRQEFGEGAAPEPFRYMQC